MIVETHPVQKPTSHGQAVAPKVMTLRAYEVYCHLYGPQEAMVTGWCRGGFAVSELLAFLYARSFPKSEWEARVQEGLAGMKNI